MALCIMIRCGWFVAKKFCYVSELFDTVVSIAAAVRSSLLEYAKFILHGCPQKHISSLWPVQKSFTIMVVKQRSPMSSSSSSTLPEKLHWLPGERRIRFKIATLTHKPIHNGSPPYLVDFLQHHRPTRALLPPCYFHATTSRAVHISASESRTPYHPFSWLQVTHCF